MLPDVVETQDQPEHTIQIFLNISLDNYVMDPLMDYLIGLCRYRSMPFTNMNLELYRFLFFIKGQC